LNKLNVTTLHLNKTKSCGELDYGVSSVYACFHRIDERDPDFFLSPISSRPEKRKSKELSINQMKWITVMLVNQFALIQGFAAA